METQEKLMEAMERIADVKDIIDLNTDHIDYMISGTQQERLNYSDEEIKFKYYLLIRSLNKMHEVNQGLSNRLDAAYLEISETHEIFEREEMEQEQQLQEEKEV